MLDEKKRIEIAKSLEDLAAQETWKADVWQRCYDLVTANMDQDDLVAYILDDLIQYTGTPLFSSAPRTKDLQPFRPQFRDMVTALRSRMSLADYKKRYE